MKWVNRADKRLNKKGYARSEERKRRILGMIDYSLLDKDSSEVFLGYKIYSPGFSIEKRAVKYNGR